MNLILCFKFIPLKHVLLNLYLNFAGISIHQLDFFLMFIKIFLRVKVFKTK